MDNVKQYVIWTLQNENIESLFNLYTIKFNPNNFLKITNNFDTEKSILFTNTKSNQSFKFTFELFEFEAIIENIIPIIVNEAYRVAKQLSDEPIDEDIETVDKVEKLIELRISSFYSYILYDDSYKDFLKYDVIFLTSYIIEGFIKRHLLTNGNKRLIYALLNVMLLIFSSLYIKWSFQDDSIYKTEKNYERFKYDKIYTNEIIKWVELSHLNDPENAFRLTEVIIDFIFNNCLLKF
ncbi:hypothetical protein [Mycoplasma seminis]|uniref:Fido domain-containing protein n=1 Tax=Mycoplasma seminis TaxID=512749 RepID=A0ABY9H9A7_9MOLU|nr:hypothetical protein [Mycoplasma seminis]WLP85148.1 hypothetical protein Q8852_02370 [Mycoplasma seminis]